MKRVSSLLLMLIAGHGHAYDGATSELSHASCGFVVASLVTRTFVESEHRAWIGFAVSTTASALHQAYQAAHGSTVASSLLDTASSAAGAALGAWTTDRYVLVPVVRKSYSGVVIAVRF
jgi:hypothetical protein